MSYRTNLAALRNMLALVISVTFDNDITGQARKMGRTAGMRNDGTNDSENIGASARVLKNFNFTHINSITHHFCKSKKK